MRKRLGILLGALLQVFFLQAQFLPINTEEGWGFINPQGEIVIEPDIDILLPQPFSDPTAGRYLVVTDAGILLIMGDSLPEKPIGFRIVDFHGKQNFFQPSKNGNSLVKLRYNRHSPFRIPWEKPAQPIADGYLALHGGTIHHLAISKDDTLYQGTDPFSIQQAMGSLYQIQAGGKYGLWNPQSQFVLPVQFDSIHYRTSGPQTPPYVVTQDTGGYTIRNLEGDIILPHWPAPVEMHNQTEFMAMNEEESAWGLINIEGDTLIPMEYEPGFRKIWDHYYLVQRSEGYGLVDSNAREILPPLYRAFRHDPNGNYWVLTKNGWGMTDSVGQLLTPTDYRRPGRFYGPVAKVYGKNKHWGLINKYGDVLAEPKYDAIQVMQNVARLRHKDNLSQVSFYENGIYDPKKRIIVRGETERRAMDSTQTKTFHPKKPGWYQKDNRWGFRDSTGVTVIRPRYAYIRELPNLNLCLLVQNQDDPKRRLSGIFDELTGKEILSPQLNQIFMADFYQYPLARATYSNGYFALVNRKGQIKRLPKVTYISEFENGLALARSGGAPVPMLNKDQYPSKVEAPPAPTGGLWGYMSPNGQWHIKPIFEKISRFERGLALVKKDGMWGAINKSGQFVIPPHFQSLSLPEGLAEASPADSVGLWFTTAIEKKRYYFFNDNKELIYTQEFDECSHFSENLLRFRAGEAWGFMDRQGKVVHQKNYVDLGDFHDQRAFFRAGRLYGFLNPQGEIAIEPQYQKATAFSEGLAAVREKNTWGYIDTLGNWVIAPKFIKASAFEDGGAIVQKKGRFGVINQRGRWIIKPKYSKIERRDDHYVLKRKNQYTAVFLNGKADKFYDFEVKPDSALPQYWKPDTAQHRSFVFDQNLGLKEGIEIGVVTHRVGLVNAKGQEILPPQYEAIRYVSGLFQVVEDGRIGYFSPQGHWVISPGKQEVYSRQ
jgi:hypothetical protein